MDIFDVDPGGVIQVTGERLERGSSKVKPVSDTRPTPGKVLPGDVIGSLCGASCSYEVKFVWDINLAVFELHFSCLNQRSTGPEFRTETVNGRDDE